MHCLSTKQNKKKKLLMKNIMSDTALCKRAAENMTQAE